LEKLWCVSKTFAKAAITSVASLYCSNKLHCLPAFLHSVNSRRRRRVPWSQIRPIFTRRRVCVSLFVDDVCCYRFPRERIRRSPRSGDFTVHFEEGTF
jgi:hypothetical protein